MRARHSITHMLAIRPLAACMATLFATGAAMGADIPRRSGAAFHADTQGTRPLRMAAAARLGARAGGVSYHAHAPKPLGGATIPVTSCADDNSGGTLREAVAIAADGDTVDLSALACSTITLTQGAIAIPIAVANLALLGPTTDTLTIDGANADRVLAHSGQGTLALTHLGIRNGSSEGTTGSSFGGCIRSAGDVSLTDTAIAHCSAGSASVYGWGGAVSADGGITLMHSSIADAHVVPLGGGGGMSTAFGEVVLQDSTISGCSADRYGGAIYAYYGNISIDGSTLSDNSVAGEGGGLFSYYGNIAVGNSTISGNSAGTQGGGIRARYRLTLNNSTVAFNSAYNGGGVYLSSYAPDIVSSIVSNNTSTSGFVVDDVAGGGGLTITGSNNLIMSSEPTTPGDTLTGDPGLSALADNGGPTWTHALGAGSIALDAGANPDALAFDQRGSGFARTAGIATDIGAYEDQSAGDEIFVDGFDGPE